VQNPFDVLISVSWAKVMSSKIIAEEQAEMAGLRKTRKAA
jgi:hypothetical protein